ncbi:MAG: hypothetical protein EXR68_02945 [Dehalococcoidia bacterium]|nr:hypothetical protein [Dehalococcoidia bacterium]
MSILVQHEFEVGQADREEFERQGREALWPTLLTFGAPMVAYGTWMFGGTSDVVATHTAYIDLAHCAAPQEGEGARNVIARLFEIDDAVSQLRPLARQTPQAAIEAPPTFGRGSVISERTLEVPRANRAEFHHFTFEVIWPWLESQGGRGVALGHDLMGSSDEITIWFAFRSAADWHRLQHPSSLGAPAEVSAAFVTRGALVHQQRGRLLTVGTDFGTKV